MKYKNKFVEVILLINYILSKKEKRKILLLIIFNVVNSFLEILSIALLIPFIGLILGNGGNKYINNFGLKVNEWSNFIVHASFILIGVFFIAMVMKIIITHANYKMSRDIGSEITLKILDKYLNLEFEEILKRGSSYVIDIVAYKCNNMVINFILPMINIISGLILIVIALLSISLLDVNGLYLALVGIVVVYICIVGVTSKIVSKISIEKNLVTGKMISSLNEAYISIRGIILSSAQKQIINDYKKLEQTYKKINILHSNISHLPRSIIEFLVITGLILYIIIIDLDELKNIIPIMVAIILGIQKTIPIIQQIYLNISSIKYGVDSNYSIIEIFNKMPKIKSLSLGSAKIESKIDILTLDKISFSYDRKNVINNLNFTAKKGDKIALMGRSGIGKSTLLDLISGLNFPDSGRVIINNYIEIGDGNIKDYFGKISYANQLPFILKDTILNNIILFEQKYDIRKINKIVKKCGLENMLLESNLTLQDRVGDGGIQLSGGQRQRVALARALYKEADIYIFDEITSGLDSASQKELLNSIYDLGDDKIIIIVSHNNENFYGCNRYYDVENGKFI